MTRRHLCVQPITKNLKLVTEDQRKFEKDPKTLRWVLALTLRNMRHDNTNVIQCVCLLNSRLTQNSSDRPLVLILSWLLGKPKHLSKYAKLYIDQGFDVLITEITPWQLLWPAKGSQVRFSWPLTWTLINLVSNSCRKSPSISSHFLPTTTTTNRQWFTVFQLVATFGANVSVRWRKTVRDFSRWSIELLDKSGTRLLTSLRFPRECREQFFPKMLHFSVRCTTTWCITWRLSTRQRHDIISDHRSCFTRILCMRQRCFSYRKLIRSERRAQTGEKTGGLLAQVIMFLTFNSFISRRVVDNWISMGINVTWKCFDRSPHVGHFMKHRDEYISYLMAHLQSVNMIKYPELLRAKL